MITINKGDIPAELVTYSQAHDSAWEGPSVVQKNGAHLTFSDVKSILKKALYKEQSGLCAYCMRRLPSPDGSESHHIIIEHLLCREQHADRALDYRNMVASCDGCIGLEKAACCDARKRNQTLSFHFYDEPFHPECIIRYDKSGKISSTNESLDHDINDILNLNHQMLKLNRAAAYKGLINKVKRRQGNKKLSTKWLEAQIKSEYDAPSTYSGIIRFFLERMLNKSM
ncbi:MAG: hypothetical protein IJ498_06070 [Akkermansia sp.]|nr:hypothetical protein [Akkermansia sp.]